MTRALSLWIATLSLASFACFAACGGDGTTSSNSSGSASASSGSGGGQGGQGGSASTGSGSSTSSSGTVDGGPQPDNHPPTITSSAVTSAMEGKTYYYPVLAEDLDADLLTFSLPVSPQGMTIDASTGLITWTPGPSAAGNADVTVHVQDPSGASDDQAFTITVAAGDQPPKITSAPPLIGVAGQTYTYNAVAVDPDDTQLTWSVTGPAGMSVSANGVVTWSVPAGAPGNNPVTLTVTDPTNKSAVQAFSIGVANGGAPPTVSITSPAADAVVKDITAVVGTATDADLAGYTLDVCPSGWGGGAAACRRFADGLSPVTNGALGSLDPRLFPNGGYEIVLSAKDAANHVAEARVPIRIDSHKLGALRLVFPEMTVQNAAVEAALERIYDGLDLRDGELGKGWRFRLSSVGHGEQPHEPQTGWDIQFISFPPSFDTYPTADHPIRLELDDGRFFEFELFLECDGALSSIHSVRPSFVEVSGTGSAIEALNAGFVPYSTVSYDLWFNFGYVSEDDLGNIEWKPTYYRISTTFGEQITFDATTGEVVIFQDETGLVVDRIAGKMTQGGQDLIQFTKGPNGKITKAKDVLGGGEVQYTYDAGGALTNVLAIDGTTQTFDYDATGRLLSFTTGGASPDVIEYDDRGRVIKRTSGDGVVTMTTYDDANKKVSQKNAAGHTVTTTYDVEGRIVDVTDPLGRKTVYSYAPGTKLIATHTDPLGHVWSYTYDAKGRRTAAKDPLNHQVLQAYHDPTGQLMQFTDAEGHVFQQSFDGQGRPTSMVFPGSPTPVHSLSYPDQTTVVVTDGLGYPTTYGTDTRGRVISKVDWAGRPWSTTFNDATRTGTMIGPNGENDAFEYDKLGRTTKVITESLGTFEYHHSKDAIPNQIVRPDGTVVDFKRDNAGKLQQILIDNKPIVQIQKNALGQVASVKQPEGARSYAYDEIGQVVQESTPSGSLAYTYDDAGRVIQIASSQGESRTLDRDPAGNITRITDGAGRTLDVGYDKDGRITSVLDGQGQLVTFTHDGVGRVTGASYPGGIGFSRTYHPSIERSDQALVATATGADGVTFSYDYDGDNNLIEASAGPGNITSYVYGPARRLEQIQDALGRLTTFTWSDGALTGLQTPGGKAQSWTNDASGRTATWTRADGTTVGYTYGTELVTKQLPSGGSYTIQRDLADLSITEVGAPGGTVKTWADDKGRPSFLSLEDGATLEIDYNAAGRVSQVVAKTPAGQTFTTSYVYDAGGKVSEVHDPDGKITLYAHDASGRVTSITRPNGTVTDYTYGVISKPLSIVHKLNGQVVKSYQYTYDARGRVLTATTPDGTFDYEYDALGRLTRERKMAGNDVVLAFNAVGNATTKTVNGMSATRAYNNDDELTGESGPNGTTTYTYTPRGALATIVNANGTTTFTYDDLDRLVGVALPGGEQITYKYDVSGRLLARTDSQGERRCLPMPATPLRLDDCALTYAPNPGAEAAEALVFSPAGLVSRHGASGARYAWAALSGTITAITDDAGAVVGEQSFDAWGNRTSATGEAIGYGFTGERQDAAAGLVFLRARHYHPATGRFLTPDQANAASADPRTLHRYLYALGDPLNNVDPTGEFSSVEMVSVQSIQNTLASIRNVAVQCLRTVTAKKIKKIIAKFMVRLAAQVVLDSLLGAANTALGALTNITEYQFQKVLSKSLCGSDGIGMIFGGLTSWQFEHKIDPCGEDVDRVTGNGNTGVPNYMDCANLTSVSNFGITGLDVVYDRKLGIELKMRASAVTDPTQLDKFCRWAARKGMHILFYGYYEFPEESFHRDMLKQCWTAWSRNPSGCSSGGSGVGSIYMAFGAHANKAKERSYVPEIPDGTSCTDFLNNL